MITLATPMAVPNLMQIRRRGGGLLGEWVKYNKNLFIYTFFREHAYRSDPSTDFHAYGSNDADWCKGVPFGGFVDIVPNFGVSPRNPNFGGTNRRFQAKHENY